MTSINVSLMGQKILSRRSLSRLDLLQWTGVPTVREIDASRYHEGGQIKPPPLKPLEHHLNLVPRSWFKGPSIRSSKKFPLLLIVR